ncbi:methyltransferase domain-containing protein [Halomonas llamarensis]|uniref:Methyltransferase domain-containing protein n=1 Tax=Halomonas llamarensis TaxID=2945104 RepID=A0ABT0SV57_9GAMM|nr:methyltransferase domain-containing protein [Halomonas llamarensis]MCL7931719.1 methyltransferase domain-containing protein [Halomonas llamarensis]
MPTAENIERKVIHNAGDGIEIKSARWTFGSDVAQKFDSHVGKSVPLYHCGHDLTVKLSDFFIKPGSTVYELGCSTGTLLSRIAERHGDQEETRFIGLDVEPNMVSFANNKYGDTSNMFFQTCRVEEHEFDKTDFITSHYTMQFLAPKYRQNVFNNIYEALEWGGAFVLFEKVRASDARFQDIFSTLYSEFKIDNGYELDEVLSKTLSLKGVLEPFTSEANCDFMRRAGFTDIIPIQKYLCFEGWLAIK